MTGVVIDTSAWIAFFRGRELAMADAVNRLLRDDAAILVGPVLTELLQGVRQPKESQQLRDLLNILPFIETRRQDWEAAGETLCVLRSRGITVPLTDALIATLAAAYGHSVLTLDNHFDHLPAPRYQPES